MQIPTLSGLIDRRMLINYRVDPAVLTRLLPPPFRPKLAHGFGIAGICLIRLKHIRPHFVPDLGLGLGSENVAHRIAVVWEEAGQLREGVFIPRRDTSSRLNTWVGGRAFPGEHHQAQFAVTETRDQFNVELHSTDGQTFVSVRAQLADALPSSSIFESLGDASAFFEAGSLGYSATHQPGRYHGLELQSHNWKVEPLMVQAVRSSFFDDRDTFPAGSIHLDCALLMRGIQHEWHARDTLSCTVAA